MNNNQTMSIKEISEVYDISKSVLYNLSEAIENKNETEINNILRQNTLSQKTSNDLIHDIKKYNKNKRIYTHYMY